MVAHSTMRSSNSEANQPPEGCGYYYVVRQNSVKEAKQQQRQKCSVTMCMSLRPFICNWLTGKEAFKCIYVIVKTHNSADPL